jgi:hypothetical protein
VPENVRVIRTWIAALCLLCGLLIIAQAWVGRFSMDPDGVSYLDMADKLGHGDFSPLLHPYWSPLYPSLLAISLKAIPAPHEKFQAVHLANGLIGLAALAAFTFFITEYLRGRAAESTASLRCRAGFAYSLFLWAALEAMGAVAVNPDFCVAALVFLAAGFCCRMAVGSGSAGPSVLLGVTLGFACLTKAAMVPLSLALFLLFAIRWFSGAARRSSLAIAFVCFLIVVGPYVTALSRQQHHLTFGESGRLNYAWSVQGGIPIFAGWRTAEPNAGVPTHPPRLLNADPPVLEFKDTVPATYPLWYNPVYFHEGLQVKFSLRKEISAVVRSFQAFRYALGISLIPLLAGLCVIGRRTSLRRVLRNLSRSLFFYWSVAAFGLYALVIVQPRYNAPFFVLFWLVLYDACSPGRLTAVFRGAISVTALCLVLFQINAVVKTATTTAGMRADAQVVVAEELERLGLRPGDEIATLGSGFDAFYARLSGLRIAANIGYAGGDRAGDEGMPALRDGDLAAIEDKLRQLDIKAIVGRENHLASAGTGWDCMDGTGYCALLLNGR